MAAIEIVWDMISRLHVNISLFFLIAILALPFRWSQINLLT